MSSIFKKIIADLWINKARSILVVLSISVGVLAVGVIISAMVIVKHDLNADYLAANPHTSRIYALDFNATVLNQLRGLPEVEEVDASYNIWLKIASVSGDLYRINLNSIDSLDSIKVDQLVFESGSRTLLKNEIFLERQGASGLGLKVGDTVFMTLENGQVYPLKLAGTVHDVQANPFKFNSATSGFVTHATMEKLGGSSQNNFVNLITTGSHTDAAHVREMTERAAEVLTANGVTVMNVNVNRPGQPQAQSTVDTVIALMGALSVLVVLLSTFLVTNTISALLGQQVRQIGVMKAIGATFGQVAGVYLGLVVTFGLIALVIAIPLGAFVSLGLSLWLIGMLNANPSSFVLPFEAILIQLFIGLVVPVLAALIPVIGAARRTVRESITNYGLISNKKPGLFDRLVDVFPWLPRPLILSIRNTFNRKSRLVLTLATLVLGGAIFIAMLGVRESMFAEVDQTLAYFQSDVNASFARAYRIEKLENAVRDTSGVTAFESWSTVDANIVRADGKTTDLIALFIPPADTKLLKAVMIDGRWLQPGDTNAIVVSNHFMKLCPEVKIGNSVLLRYQEEETHFEVVGFFRMSGNYPAPFTYITPDGYSMIGGDPMKANLLKIVTDQHTPGRQKEVLNSIQSKFKDLGFEATLQTGSEIVNQQRAVVSILITLLVVMSLMIAVVGGLGLMGTMGMNILERTREIGVLRSIGAENKTIFQMVIVEGILIGFISWVFSAIVAVPITQFLDNSLGNALMTVPIIYIFSTKGLLIWLVVVLLLSVLASVLPARSAVKLTVRDVLAYE